MINNPPYIIPNGFSSAIVPCSKWCNPTQQATKLSGLTPGIIMIADGSCGNPVPDADFYAPYVINEHFGESTAASAPYSTYSMTGYHVGGYWGTNKNEAPWPIQFAENPNQTPAQTVAGQTNPYLHNGYFNACFTDGHVEALKSVHPQQFIPQYAQ